MSEQPCWLITTKHGGELVTVTHKGSLFDFLRDYDTPILWAQKISVEDYITGDNQNLEVTE